eukprot:scaffold243894_cov32-Prasinocladus_malaysianus.AAC.1
MVARYRRSQSSRVEAVTLCSQYHPSAHSATPQTWDVSEPKQKQNKTPCCSKDTVKERETPSKKYLCKELVDLMLHANKLLLCPVLKSMDIICICHGWASVSAHFQPDKYQLSHREQTLAGKLSFALKSPHVSIFFSISI